MSTSTQLAEVEHRMPTTELVVGIVLNCVIAPGAGHAFAGYERRALSILALFAGAGVVGAILFHSPSGTAWTLVLGVLLMVAVRIGTAVDLLRLARRGKIRGARKRSVRVVLAVGCAVIVLALSLVVTTASRAWWGRPFRTPTSSMEPTLLAGDRFYTNERIFRAREPRRGEVVVCSPMQAPSQTFIKRVVGLPGDVIVLRGDVLMINDEPRHVGDTPDRHGGFESLVVPEGGYFVLGDNTVASRDSRHWGAVPRDLVIGSPTHIYWSQDPRTGTIRWGRIGQLVQ